MFDLEPQPLHLGHTPALNYIVMLGYIIDLHFSRINGHDRFNWLYAVLLLFLWRVWRAEPTYQVITCNSR